MNFPRLLAVPLIVLNLLLVGLYAFIVYGGGSTVVPEWMAFLAFWSIFGIQFTWGVAIGLFYGPGRATMSRLWLSALPLVIPIYHIGMWCFALLWLYLGWPLGWVVLMFLTLAGLFVSQTFCGVLLGAWAHDKLAKWGRDSGE